MKIVTGALVALFMMVGVSNAQDKHKKGSWESSSVAKMSGSITGQAVTCQSGDAGGYPCQEIDLLSFMDRGSLNDGGAFGVSLNDIWGWTDPTDGTEYALVGLNTGTAFVSIADPENPVKIGFLPTHSSSSTWRDIKVYNNHAYIVSEASGHGMQVFDLTQLKTATPPTTFQATAHYDNVSKVHNIFINEDSGFAYIVGANGGGTTCGGGLHMVNLATPASPQFAGCFADTTTGRSGTGYSHDVQCVMYTGPDTEHQGKEICVGSNETAISVADVSDKNNPTALSTGTYPQATYVHQGWFSEDQKYFFLDDELDERSVGIKTTTIVWDMTDLDDPVVLTKYVSDLTVIDHNMYVKGNYIFQSNYNAGLRILDSSDPANLTEIAYFDTRPNDESANFDGSWSNYPYFESGVIIATSIGEGLYVLQPEVTRDKSTAVDETPEVPADMTLSAPYPNPFDVNTQLTLSVNKAQRAEVAAFDMLGRKVAVLFDGQVTPDNKVNLSLAAQDLPNGNYIVRATSESGTQSRVVTLVR